MDHVITILLNGDVHPTDELKGKLSNTCVIAADGGIRHAESLGLKPDVWIGDFDSTNEDLANQYQYVQRQAYDHEKDISDGELALEYALSRKPRKLIICGVFGGTRFDHSLFNVLGLLRYALANPEIEFVMESGAETAFPLKSGDKHVLDAAAGTTFSIVPVSALDGLTIEGAKWPLANVKVPIGSSITLSNIVQTQVMICLERGEAILVVQNR